MPDVRVEIDGRNQLSQMLAPALFVVGGSSVLMAATIWDDIWLGRCLYILATAKNGG